MKGMNELASGEEQEVMMETMEKGSLLHISAKSKPCLRKQTDKQGMKLRPVTASSLES